MLNSFSQTVGLAILLTFFAGSIFQYFLTKLYEGFSIKNPAIWAACVVIALAATLTEPLERAIQFAVPPLMFGYILRYLFVFPVLGAIGLIAAFLPWLLAMRITKGRRYGRTLLPALVTVFCLVISYQTAATFRNFAMDYAAQKGGGTQSLPILLYQEPKVSWWLLVPRWCRW